MLKNKVQQFRKRLNLTQADLALKVEVTRQTIISVEKENYVPSVQLAMKLAKVLKTSVEDLFYESKK
ncbi:MAG: helix-turn-helix transcriptional regulator [Candidatus Paceibacterota bacterium]